jgi:ABC-type glycerol-3-phosphate transport system permease component
MATYRKRPSSGGFSPLFKLAIYGFLVSWAVVELFPILFMFLQSVKTDQEIVGNLWGLPASPRLGNFQRVWEGGSLGVPMGRYFLNSIVVTTATLLFLMVTGSLAAYALARYRFPGERILQTALIWALAVPAHATLIPVFRFMGDLGLRNTYWGLSAVYTAFWLPFTILFLRAYFTTFPRELEEAARLDGASELGVFFRIVLPISRGALASVSIVNVVGIWSELLFAFVLMNQQDMKTLTVGMLAFRGQYSVEWSSVFAGLTIAAVPTLLFFLVFQRQITKGMTMGALK